MTRPQTQEEYSARREREGRALRDLQDARIVLVPQLRRHGHHQRATMLSREILDAVEYLKACRRQERDAIDAAKARGERA